MHLDTLLIPYFLVSLVLIACLENVSILKWNWEPSPFYITIPVGLLWPIWLLVMLIYAAFGKIKSHEDQ